MRHYRLTVALLIIAGMWLLITRAVVVKAESVAEIRQKIEASQARLAELKKQAEIYQNAIAQKQGQALTLKKELAIIDDQIARAKLQLESNELNLTTTTLQINALSLEIAQKQREINERRLAVAAILRQLHEKDERSIIQILLLSPTLGDFYEQINYFEQLEHQIQDNITKLNQLSAELETRQQDLLTWRGSLVKTRQELENSKNKLALQLGAKQTVLKQTKVSESKYQSLLAEAVAEQNRASSDIANLETEVRRRLNQQGSAARERLGDAKFIWPVAPNKGLSTLFYDPEYIFRRYFEHPGIDIPTPQGTPIKASDGGYVARAKDAGLGYSYIMIIHQGGLATVYGHVSRIDVAEETYVTKGQIIGATGGLPGTRGAGRLTTGPHLHFEMRSGGLPVNPVEYLP